MLAGLEQMIDALPFDGFNHFLNYVALTITGYKIKACKNLPLANDFVSS